MGRYRGSRISTFMWVYSLVVQGYQGGSLGVQGYQVGSLGVQGYQVGS